MGRIINKLVSTAYPPVEHLFRTLQKSQLSRGATLDLIPRPADRGGGLGTTTYGEWCYTIGMFQSLIFANLPKTRPIRMLDVGCGVGRLYLAAKPYLMDDDRYVGLDIGKDFIEICRKQYRDANCEFVHVDASNPYYADHLTNRQLPWPIENESRNLVTALSVWTHLNEADWRFYLNEVGRVLVPGGRAVISFFILDQLYRDSLSRRSSKVSRYYPQPENKWVFDAKAYASEKWYYPSWAQVPEVAIGIDEAAFDAAVSDAGLVVNELRPGSWKEQPGFFFQDVAIFEKR